ncbi:MAG TPA: helix-turn-helix transcriptional regulator [Micromonosporaceae bacterium]|nr:helix-turn-helix transcriptional regulator [Micromonosporaceae bacterium]
MMTGRQQLARSAGELLRQWREHRRLSQLELASQAGVSTRHLSFVETGRSMPSRDMVLHLVEQLDLPLRERNQVLLAAGYAPVYPETALDAPQMVAVRAALRQVLNGHQPYPALVVDRRWNVVDTNPAVALFTRMVSPALLQPVANVLRASLHPDGLAPHLVNLGEWRAHLLGRLRRQISHSSDPELVALYDELTGYPCAQPDAETEPPGPGSVVVPMRFRAPERELVFLSTVAMFGSPLDLTVAELAIESFYPADAETAAYLQARAGSCTAT